MYHSALTSALSDASHGDDKASTHRAHPGGRAPHRRVRRRLRSRDRAGLRRRQTASSVCRRPRITAYLPLLAHRFARERLRACGLVEGSLPKSVPVVLFVCTHNTRRSQLAAALLARAAGNWVLIASAGTAPASAVAPAVLEVLGERSIDASDAYPKPLTEEVVAAADVVITMGCGDACPILPGRRYLDGDLADPMGPTSRPCGRSEMASRPGFSCSSSNCSPRLRRHRPEHVS
jgi:arsenate reductase (thioredoxin)